MEKMYTAPIILPLDIQGRVYVLEDEKGNTVGTGTRQACEVLLSIIKKAAKASSSISEEIPVPQTPGVRAAMTI